MMVSWIIYTVLVSALVAAAAAALEPVAKAFRLPVRLLWFGALVMSLSLCILAPARSGHLDTASETAITSEFLPGVSAAELSTRADRLGILSLIPDALALSLSVVPSVGERTSAVIVIGWLVMSAALLALGTWTLRRYLALLRVWPIHEVEGERVRVAPSTGPVVIGLLRPEIVIPSWLTSMPAEMRRLVILHEREHLRTRDPLLVAAGAVVVVLIPWSPPLWWMLHRLRLAVEIDCDTRVLGSGVPMSVYGTTLIDIARRNPTLAPGAPALLRSRSSLERRLLAMNRRLSWGRIARLAIASPLGLAILFGACEANPPTSAEIEAMDMAALETRLEGITAFPGASRFFVDGEVATADEARAVPAEMIAKIVVLKESLGGAASEVRITTRAAAITPPEAAAADPLQPGSVRVRGAEGAEPLFIIDGEVAATAAFNNLDPNTIESISVMKGSSTPPEYAGDPRASAGVILVATKEAAR